MKRSNKKGFTIVELVIVIAIIAILAAVLIPTFASLIQKANEANARAEAKNLITEMLADILTGEDGEADLLVFSNKGNDVYVYGYSREAGRVIAYCENPKAIPSGKSFEDYVNADDGLLAELKTKKVITEVADLAADDWRQPDKTKEIVNQLDSKGGGMLLFANYTIKLDAFQYANALTVNGKGYDNFSEAVLAAKDGGTITLSRNEAFKFTATEATTLKNITFKAADGITVKGLELNATKKANKLTLDNIKFEGISFTNRVVLGQTANTNGISQVSNITFENCNFDMPNKSTNAIYRATVSIDEENPPKEKTDNAVLNGLTIRNCSFNNNKCAVWLYDVRDLTIEGCSFSNSNLWPVTVTNVLGTVVIKNNVANGTKGVFFVGCVGNNYRSVDNKTEIHILNNIATNMTCPNGEVFKANFDNYNFADGRPGTGGYEIKGNDVSYSQTFENPLNGFWLLNAGSAVKDESKLIPNE